jgi:CHAT domain-containing protein/tetratricopeptide (TPR) repeat protein
VGTEDPEYALGLNNLALALEELGRYREACELLENAVRIAERESPQDAAQLAIYLHHLAGMYRLDGRFASALRTFRRALAIRNECLDRDDPLIGDTLNDLALLHVDMGRLRIAERLYKRVLRQNEACNPVREDRVAAVQTNLGGVHNRLGEWSLAEEFYQKALNTLVEQQGGEHPTLPTILDNLGGVWARQSRREEARVALERALEIRKARYGPTHTDVAVSLNNLSAFWLDAGDVQRAERYGSDALEMRRVLLGSTHPLVAQSQVALARTLALGARRTEALRLLEQAAQIHDNLVGLVFDLHSDAQRLAFIDTLMGALGAYLGLLADQVDRTAEQVRRAFEHTIKRLRLGAEAAARERTALRGDADTVRLFKDLRNTRGELARLTLAGAATQELADRVESLEAEISDRVHARNDVKVDAYRSGLQADTAALLTRLGPRSCLIQFVQIVAFDFDSAIERDLPSSRYLAFVVRPGGEPPVVLVDLGPAQAIDAAVTGYLREVLGAAPRPSSSPSLRDFSPALQTVGKAASPRCGAAVRQMVFEPLQPLLAQASRLLIALDGQLYRLPFEAIPLSADARGQDPVAPMADFLGDRFDVQYLSVSRDLLRDSPLSSDVTAPLVMADPAFDLAEGCAPPPLPQYPFGSLPGARREGEMVAAMLGVPLLAGEQATKTVLQSRVAPRILHLATHGFFLGAPPTPSGRALEPELAGQRMEVLRSHPLLRSGLALAGCNSWLQGQTTSPQVQEGLLTALDVSALDLSGTEVVVLSACETALGELLSAEGVYGLSRAFVLAGAGMLITSLWRVGDDVTRELMEELYRSAALGSDFATALIHARRQIKQRHPNVRDWAAFVCQGFDNTADSSGRLSAG